MSVVILGAKGMLGYALVDIFSEEHDVVAFDKDELDITNLEMIRDRFADARPDTVINAAAYTDVDGAEQNEELATKINGEAVSFLAKACVERDATLIHYSTDYIFEGTNPDGYDEDEAPAQPVNAYGRSKLAGEQALWRIGLERLPFYIIRTSWLYGPNGKNFVDTILKLGGERSELKVVNDQYGKPTYTYDLANATRELISTGDEYHDPGVYHITNETEDGGITWYDFAVEIFKQRNLSLKVTPVSSDEFPRSAKRPQYSTLKNTKIFLRRPWQEALEEYLTTYAPR